MLLLLLLLVSGTLSTSEAVPELSFLELGSTAGVDHVFLPAEDDAVSDAISVPGGLPIYISRYTEVYVMANGIFYIGQQIGECCPYYFQQLPSGTTPFIAPYWVDSDPSVRGNVSYEVHATNSSLLQQVSNYVSFSQNMSFNGTWMMVAYWWDVPELFLDDTSNTYQAVIITDGMLSYAIFIYKCGALEVGSFASIGYYFDDSHYDEYTFSNSPSSSAIACVNTSADYPWKNVIYWLNYPHVQFDAVAYTVSEGQKSLNVCMILNLDFVTPLVVNANISEDTPVTATGGGVDFIDGNLRYFFPYGKTQSCGVVWVIDDDEILEGRELFVISITNVSDERVLLGINSTSTVFIEDDDACESRLSNTSGSLQTPGWPHNYPSLDFQCQWIIDLKDDNYIIEIITDNSTYGILGTDPCLSDYLAFYDGLTIAAPSLGRYCSLDPPPSTISTSHQVLVVFQASSHSHSPNRVGARVSYEAIRLVDECQNGNGGCDQICEDTPLAFTCQCEDGFVLTSNERSCDDINECTIEDNRCEQECINTVGSFICACAEGYALNEDGFTCHISCGGTYIDNEGSFHTPGWPKFYPLDFRCEWIIQTPVGGSEMVLKLTVNTTAYGIHGSPPCDTDYLEFYDGVTTDDQLLGKYCKFDKPDVLYTSSSQALVVFQASTAPHLPSRVGVQVFYQLHRRVNECAESNGGCEGICVDTVSSFECRCDAGYTLHSDGHSCEDINECTGNHNCEESCVNIEGSFHCACGEGFILASNERSCVPSCGGRLTQTAGSFSTPGWPQYYPSIDFRCVWVIDIENHTDTLIDITFSQHYGIHGRDSCPTDYVQVLDGIGKETPSLGKFCFHTVPQPIITSSHQATVIFQASSLPHLRSRVGVGITYTTIRKVNECDSDNGGCGHICVDTVRSYMCACREGYTLDEDGIGCSDINECVSTSHGCDHQCVNTEGAYSCVCRDGYALDSDNRACSVSCGGTLTGMSGSFQTPDWPNRYPQLDFHCLWIMKNLTAGQSVRFEVDASAYGISGRPPCSADHIEFFNGTESTASSLGRFCKLNPPEPITVTAGGARVVFQGRRNRYRPASRVGVRVLYAVLDSE